MNQDSPSNISFIVVVEEEPPQRNFSLKDLPSASKIDVIARNILALFPNQTPNLNITYYAFFTQKSPKALMVRNLVLHDISMDEIFIASKIRDALESLTIEENNREDQLAWISHVDFQTFLEKIANDNDLLFYLKEDGDSFSTKITRDVLGKKIVFLLGGRRDISAIHEKVLLSFDLEKISLGEKAYLASQCLTLIKYEIEKLMNQ